MVCLCEGKGTAVRNRNGYAVKSDKRNTFEVCYKEDGQRNHYYSPHLNHQPNLIRNRVVSAPHLFSPTSSENNRLMVS